MLVAYYLSHVGKRLCQPHERIASRKLPRWNVSLSRRCWRMHLNDWVSHGRKEVEFDPLTYCGHPTRGMELKCSSTVIRLRLVSTGMTVAVLGAYVPRSGRKNPQPSVVLLAARKCHARHPEGARNWLIIRKCQQQPYSVRTREPWHRYQTSLQHSVG